MRLSVLSCASALLLGALIAPLASAGGTTGRTIGQSPAKVVTIGQRSTGSSLTGSSLGLSYEVSDLALPSFTSGNLATYLRTLGRSVIRIGGSTSDETFWTSHAEKAPSWSIATITPADLDALGRLARASGWKVILGVNLKHNDPSRAADEAAHASRSLGPYLQAIEIGNEPNYYRQYSRNHQQYFKDFETYAAAIKKAVPGVAIEGTDDGNTSDALYSDFVKDESRLARPDIAELTSHEYPLVSSKCGGHPTIADLLGPDAHLSEKQIAEQAAAQAARLHVPALFDEANSAVCGGQHGVSNVFASALWVLDDELTTAREGVAGDYLHGTIVQCGSADSLYNYYTPLCAPTAADAAAGRLAAQPEYYGLAAVHLIGTGDFLQVNDPTWTTVRAFALRHTDGTMTVVLDNVQDPAHSGPTTLRLGLGASFAAGRKVGLTAGSLTTTTGIALGGQTVAADGHLALPRSTPFQVGGNTLTISVPAGTAEILTLTPTHSPRQ
ncbi:MAG: hypothetical protein JO362_14645 [Streptomycetaceae bacterium]|nr:hypothetical protein [Streptomycetaceae bacterium]